MSVVKRKRVIGKDKVFVARQLRSDEWINFNLLSLFAVSTTTCIEIRVLSSSNYLVRTMGTYGPDFEMVMSSAIRMLLLVDAEIGPGNALIILQNIVVFNLKICSESYWNLWLSSEIETSKAGKTKNDGERRWRTSYSDYRSLLLSRRRLFLLNPNTWILYKSMQNIHLVDGVRTPFYTQNVLTTLTLDATSNPDCGEQTLKARRHQLLGLYAITEQTPGGQLVVAEDVPIPPDATCRKHVVHKNPWVELFYYFCLLCEKCFDLITALDKTAIQITETLDTSLRDLWDDEMFLDVTWISFVDEIRGPVKADYEKGDPLLLLVLETNRVFCEFFTVVNASELHIYFTYFRGKLTLQLHI
jgi:hypothetical protein